MAKRSKRTDNSTLVKNEDKFLLALGRFIQAFARVEQMMNYVALHYSQMPLGTARAIFLPLRADASIQIVRRIVAARRPDSPFTTELLTVLAHVDAIRDVRNALVHYRINSGPLITNRPWARNRKAVWSQKVTVKNLGQMTDDLEECGMRLAAHHVGGIKRRLFRVPSGVAFLTAPIFGIRMFARSKPAWQYTPPEQPTSRRNRRHGRDRGPSQ